MGDDVGMAERRKLRAVIAVQVAIPLALLVERILSGDINWYGWGWQMYS